MTFAGYLHGKLEEGKRHAAALQTRAEQAEAAVVTASGKMLECAVANALERAERAEALLRDAALALERLTMRENYFDFDESIGLATVYIDTPIGIAREALAKVRALLDGKT